MHHNRLTVVGGGRKLRQFQESDWLPAVAGGRFELLELSPRRFAGQFDTKNDPLPALVRLSRSHPGLIFLLEYERARCKGLAKAQAGRLIHHRIRY